MLKYEDNIRMKHMLEYSREALTLTYGGNREELDTDRTLSMALARLLEIVGEAASRVTEETQARFPEVPWNTMIGLRDRLLQDYDSVDLDLVWQLMTGELPNMVAFLQKVI
jgi:uncharacterized protein with HEPN domain